MTKDQQKAYEALILIRKARNNRTDEAAALKIRAQKPFNALRHTPHEAAELLNSLYIDMLPRKVLAERKGITLQELEKMDNEALKAYGAQLRKEK